MPGASASATSLLLAPAACSTSPTSSGWSAQFSNPNVAPVPMASHSSQFLQNSNNPSTNQYIPHNFINTSPAHYGLNSSTSPENQQFNSVPQPYTQQQQHSYLPHQQPVYGQHQQSYMHSPQHQPQANPALGSLASKFQQTSISPQQGVTPQQPHFQYQRDSISGLTDQNPDSTSQNFGPPFMQGQQMPVNPNTPGYHPNGPPPAYIP
jgi:hypothetical protein